MITRPLTKQLTGTISRIASPALGEEEVTITTPRLDLMRDRVISAGMDLGPYLNGPRAVNLHHWERPLPVARTLALAQTPEGIRARFRWIENSAEVAEVRNVFEQGALGASIEFNINDCAPNAEGGFDFTKTTLTGWALTGNPANLDCVKMYKALRRWSADDRPSRSGRGSRPPGWWLPRDATLTVVDSEDDLVSVSDHVFRAAYAEVIGREVQRQLNRLTGRVD